MAHDLPGDLAEHESVSVEDTMDKRTGAPKLGGRSEPERISVVVHSPGNRAPAMSFWQRLLAFVQREPAPLIGLASLLPGVVLTGIFALVSPSTFSTNLPLFILGTLGTGLALSIILIDRKG